MTLSHADRIEGPLFSRLSLALQFAVAGAAVLVVGMVLIGLWVTSRIEREAVRNAGSATALYVDSIIAPLTSELTSAETLSEDARKTLTETLQQGALSTRLFSFKLWRTDGTIIFSSEPSLIGKRFKVSPKLASASAGTVHAEFDAALNEQYLRRISAELHDGPTQLLGFAALRLEAISTARARDDDALRVQQSLNTAIEDIRNICRGLTLPELEMLSGGDVALRAIREHETHSRGEVLARIAPVHVASQAAKICIYRFIQETLSNAARHAKASRASVSVAEEGGMVETCVEDGGVGFVRCADDRGLGLTGLEERITGLGGQLEIQSGSAGSMLRMKIPAHDTDHA
jgi:signal transduction histidine kinase